MEKLNGIEGHRGFAAKPHYFPDGDFVKYFFKNDRAYAKRVDDLVTVYLSVLGDELVGVKIKGVAQLVEEVGGPFGVAVMKGKTVALAMLFIVIRSRINEDAQKELDKVAAYMTNNGSTVEIEPRHQDQRVAL